MAIEVSLNTPLGDALISAIQPKIVEVGWGTGGADDQALAEYVVLMLGNNQTQEQIASELSSDLLNLGPDDPSTHEFTKWLFEHLEHLDRQINGGDNAMAGAPQEGASAEMDMDMASTDVSGLNAPTGPRSMRNGNNNNRGGRDKRMFGQMNKAMDRSTDGALHRVRGTGNERINTHGRTPPTGPRSARGGMGRNNNRAANIQAGLAGMAAGGPQAQWMMQGGQPNQMELVAMLEQQNQMMYQLSQQLMAGGGQSSYNNRRGGKSDRGHDRNNFRRNQNRDNKQDGNKPTGEGEGEDVAMGGANRDPPNPDDTVCKYNLRCTNKDCKFAHQSPAAPPGASVDVNDNCTFGAACKNRKCVARHPSPAARLAHQSEQDCKFFPNCHNPQCPFKHPSMPLCRNGADCTTEGCKFTHVKTKCRFNPCLNPNCAFAHEEGQQGGFKDKVWTAGGEEHVSERKFVDDQATEELVKPDEEGMKQDTEVIG
ncbi:hypothetical protein B0T10DRAFT_557430 [Thelonectria olida]|uniref:Nab2-like CCCH zinc finger domain-containing protein n=1 Tax=Thelonectria olida TaxID=1576542 RepID=A0A9P8W9V8_9HYPO|nr:hypothetical protein B0T10DRAFT_557430 [Thelonectria olida]